MRARGHRQREERLRASLSAQWDSELGQYLKELFCFGLLSAQKLQQLAQKAVNDHTESPGELVELARLGSDGRHPNHCHHQLMDLLRAGHQPQITNGRLPLNVAKGKWVSHEMEVAHSFISPCDTIGNMFKHFPKGFAKRFLGAGASVANARDVLRFFFGGGPEEDPRKIWLRGHLSQREDIQSEEDMWGRAVPIALHGDGVPVAGQSLEAISITGVLADMSLSSMDLKIFISGVLSNAVSKNTKNNFWAIVCWFLLFLQLGVHPETDWEGTDLVGDAWLNRGKFIAGGLFFVIWMVKGDMEWFNRGLNLEHSTAEGGMCPWCRANYLEEPLDEWAIVFGHLALPWNDWSTTALWIPTIWTDRESWAAYHVGNVHQLFMMQLAIICCLMADPLHIIDLGVSHVVLGNVLFQLCYMPGYVDGGNPTERLDNVWTYIMRQYRARATPSQLHGITLNMFTNTGGPHAHYPLLGGLAKAAITRHLVPIIADLWDEVHKPTVVGDQYIARCLHALTKVYESFDTPDYTLSAAQKRNILAETHDFLNSYRWLRHNAGAAKRWQEIPKFHFMIHVALQAQLQNPRRSWTYVDEDWMGLIKDICQSCMHGTPSFKVVAKIVSKLVVGSTLRLMRQERL